MTAAADLYAAGVRDGQTWMPMSGGVRFDLLSPRAKDVVWRDVAIRLARSPRCGGAMRWSLAEHSLLVMSLCPAEARAHGLLHDAHEFVLGDWVTPLKAALIERGAGGALAGLETPIAAAIHQAAGLPFPPPESIARAVAEADRQALSTERRDVLDAGCAAGWGEGLPAPARGRLKPEALNGAQERVAERFLTALRDLTTIDPETAR